MLAEALAEMGIDERTVMEVAEDPPVEEPNGPPREAVENSEVIAEFEVDGQTITLPKGGTYEVERERMAVGDATDAVVGHAKARFGGTDAIEGNEAEILTDLVAESPRGINADWKYSAETAEWQLSSVAEEFGYRIEFRSLGDEHIATSTSATHPQAFEIARIDPDGDERTVPFRYPPRERDSHLNYHALAEAVDRELLLPVGLRLVELLGRSGDNFRWFLFEIEQLRELEGRFGEGLPIRGDPLVDSGPFVDAALADYDPDCALDHEAAYGVPEPADTVKIEAFADVTECGEP